MSSYVYPTVLNLTYISFALNRNIGPNNTDLITMKISFYKIKNTFLSSKFPSKIRRIVIDHEEG